MFAHLFAFWVILTMTVMGYVGTTALMCKHRVREGGLMGIITFCLIGITLGLLWERWYIVGTLPAQYAHQTTPTWIPVGMGIVAVLVVALFILSLVERSHITVTAEPIRHRRAKSTSR